MKHYLSSDQVLKEAWSPEDEALKIKIASGAEFSVELNHKDGDSVHVFRKMVEVVNEAPLDCSDMNQVCLFGEATVMISPLSTGEMWFELPLIMLRPKIFCAKRIKIVKKDPKAMLLLKA